MSRSAGILLGFVLDRVVADPRRGHPVAAFGHAAGRLERVLWRDNRASGVVHVAVLVGGATAFGAWLERRPLHTLTTAVATWAVLGGTTLDREAAAVEELLAHGRLDDARARVTHLVGRDTAQLDESGIARAATESVAENTSDAVVAPLVWGALAGIPGLLAYRAANTLDAMVGHRSSRYARFGWAAARLDDLLNLPGSRLTAALAVLLGGAPSRALRTWRRDAAAHPSPNAGPVEAAFAGALGLKLGGRNVYGELVEDRAVLGDGSPPTRTDLTKARRLARRVNVAALVVTATAASGARRARRGR